MPALIETPRLLLRPPILADLPHFTEMRADFERSEHAGGGLDAAGAWTRFATIVGCWQLYGFGMFSVILKEDSQWIGTIGPVNMYSWVGQEFGWATIASAANKGYAFEAARAALDWCFEILEFDEYVHTISFGNQPSINLAKKLGAHFCGKVTLPAPHEGKENELWKSYKSDWKKP